jgi:hypothetical protein
MNKKLLLLAVLGCLLCNQNYAQSAGTESPALNPNPEAITISPKKGAFFITPFYQFVRFENLKLTSNTTYYTFPDETTSRDFTDADVTQFNESYDTKYSYSMTGIRFGYHLADGLGISGYAGIKHFFFETMITEVNTETHSADYPALTTGIAIDYKRKITGSLSAMASASCNYTKTSKVSVDSKYSEDILSSQLISKYWDANVALAYGLGRFMPFAGVGFTQQFVNTITQEQYTTADDNGQPYNEVDKFDSHFQGQSVYGFAGLEYLLGNKISLYARGAFINPYTLNLGIRIII